MPCPHRFTVLPSYPFTVLPSYRLTVLPSYRLYIKPFLPHGIDFDLSLAANAIKRTINFYRMAIIKKVRGHEPQFGKDCFLADNAVVVGEVSMGNNCTVWFNAVVRGDVNSIAIGDNTNIQDGAVIHGNRRESSIRA